MDVRDRQDLPAGLHSRLSHDIRSRINIILGYCDILGESLRDSDTYYLQTLRNTARQLLLTDAEIRHLTGDLPETSGTLQQLLDILGKDHPHIVVTINNNMPSPPASVIAMLQSVVTKFSLSYLGGSCTIHQSEGSITVQFSPADQARYPIRDFLKRFRMNEAIDPKKDFDSYYLKRLGDPAGANVSVSDNGMKITWLGGA